MTDMDATVKTEGPIDADQNRNDSSDPSKDLKNQLERAEKESRENYERLLRVSAEFENYKKRSAREMDEFRKFSNESLLRDFLVVADSLERAIHSTSERNDTRQSILEGIQLVISEIHKIFARFSVKPISALNAPFDPTFHQAVVHETTDAYSENTVIKELQKGYLIHDRLLRPAMVVVSKSDSVPKGESESGNDITQININS
ncbi:MAG: nucleotide exchange factor GrpE [Thermodesulfobacteriota bacterium]